MKQTEVGLIPDDWEVKKLEEICYQIGDIDHKMPASVSNGIPYLMTGDFIGENEFNFADSKKISLADYNSLSKKIKPELNDVIFARYASIGAVRFIETIKPFLVSYSCAILKIKDSYEKKFVFYSFFSNILKNQEELAINTGTQANIGIESLKNFLLPIPPLAEQQRIAKALSDVDALISTTEKLLQKKKNIKQGAMQELLTGKKRLPGFAKSTNYKQSELGPIPGDWEVKRIIDICDNYSYGVGAAAIKYDGRNQYIRITDIDDESRAFIPNPVTSPSYISEKCYVNNGDILIARTGNSVGKSYHYSPQDGKLIFAGFLMRIHVNSANSKYVFYNTLTTRYNNWICSESMRSGQPGISLEQIKQFIIALPPEEEQTAIANVLSSMDKEIETLNTKLEKYRNLKTAMMQQLLTGKIRLVKQ